MATIATNTIALNVTGNAGQELAKLQTNVDKLTKSFGALQASLGIAAMAAFAASTIKFADDMQDLANATGIATNNIIGLTKTFQQNGGSAEQARAAVLKLTQSIGDASEGNQNALESFKKVGVSIYDLQKLSEQDVLAKTIQGLAKISDVSLRTKLAMDLMGKGAKGVDFTGVAAGYASASREAMKYNEAVKASAALNDKFEAAVGKLKLSFLKAFEPIADAINKLDDEKINKVIESLGQMAVALTAIASLGKAFEWLGRGLAFLAVSAAALGGGFSSLSTTISKAVESTSQWWRQTPRFAELGGKVASLGKLFGEFGSRLLFIPGALAAISKGLLGWLGILWLVNDAVDLLTGKGFIGWLSTAYDKMKAMIGMKSELDATGAGGGRGKMSQAEIDGIVKNGEAQRAEGERTQKALTDQAERFAEMRSTIALNNSLKDADEIKTIQLNAAAEIAKAKQDIANKYAGMPDEKIKAEQSLKAAEILSKANLEIYKIQKQRTIENAKFTDQLERQVELYGSELHNGVAQIDQVNSLLMKNGKLTNISEDQLAIEKAKLQMTQGLRTALAGLQSQVQDLELDQKLGVGDPAENARRIELLKSKYQQLQIQTTSYQMALEDAMKTEQAIKMIQEDRIRTIENMNKAIEDQIARQQTLGGILQGINDKKVDLGFETAQAGRNPLQKQMAQIQEDARKAALEAGRTFAAGFQDMDLTAAQAKELADGLDQIAKSYEGIAKAQTDNLIASRSWEAGWKTAFDNYMDNATNAATRAGEVFSAVTSNMNSAIDNFVMTGKSSFEDLAKSIIQDLIKIELKAQATKLLSMIGGGGGILSTIGSFLGFAEGGNPPINKPSIVGEKGPELFIPRSAGTIVPNGAGMGGGVVNKTYITNNISAIDSKSVAQMFAENRKALLGTVQLAQKELPYGNR
jgi:lambda family phage tail tape measure protein